MGTAAVTNAFTASTTIVSDDMDTNFGDLVTFLNASVLHIDGAKTMTGDLKMGTKKLTGLGAGTSDNDAVRFEQLNAPNVKAGATTVGNDSSGLGTTYADEAVVIFTLPAAWTTALILAWGSVGMEQAASGTEVICRVQIGGSVGTVAPSGPGPANAELTVSASFSTNVSATTTIALEAKTSTGIEDRSHASISYIAIQLT